MNRKMIAMELLGLAKEIVGMVKGIDPRVEFVFERSDDVEKKDLDFIFNEIQKFVATIHKNEQIATFVKRTDTEKDMVMEIGLADHEELSAIVDYVKKMVKKMVRKREIDVGIRFL